MPSFVLLQSDFSYFFMISLLSCAIFSNVFKTSLIKWFYSNKNTFITCVNSYISPHSFFTPKSNKEQQPSADRWRGAKKYDNFRNLSLASYIKYVKKIVRQIESVCNAFSVVCCPASATTPGNLRATLALYPQESLLFVNILFIPFFIFSGFFVLTLFSYLFSYYIHSHIDFDYSLTVYVAFVEFCFSFLFFEEFEVHMKSSVLESSDSDLTNLWFRYSQCNYNPLEYYDIDLYKEYQKNFILSYIYCNHHIFLAMAHPFFDRIIIYPEWPTLLFLKKNPNPFEVVNQYQKLLLQLQNYTNYVNGKYLIPNAPIDFEVIHLLFTNGDIVPTNEFIFESLDELHVPSPETTESDLESELSFETHSNTCINYQHAFVELYDKERMCSYGENGWHNYCYVANIKASYTYYILCSLTFLLIYYLPKFFAPHFRNHYEVISWLFTYYAIFSGIQRLITYYFWEQPEDFEVHTERLNTKVAYEDLRFQNSKVVNFSDSCVVYKKQSKKKKDLDLHNNTGLVFDMQWHNNKKIPFWLSQTTYEQIPVLIGSLVARKDDKPKTAADAALLREYRRKLNLVKLKWQECDGIELLKDFLVEVYGDDNEVAKPPINNSKPRKEFKYHKFEENPKIFFDKFHDEHYQPINKGKKQIPALLIEDRNGIFYDILEGANHTSQMLTQQKIRSMLWSMIHNDKEPRDISQILAIINKKCHIWRPGQKIDPIKDYPKLSWCVPYIPYYWLNIGTTNLHDFSQMFREKLITLRDRIIKFANDYYNGSKLTQAERKFKKKQQSKIIAEKMRSKEIQLLFANGWTKDQVVKKVYSESINQIVNVQNDVLIEKKIEGKHAKRQIKIKYRRDKEIQNNLYQHNEDFETHMMHEEPPKKPASGLYIIFSAVAAYFIGVASFYVILMFSSFLYLTYKFWNTRAYYEMVEDEHPVLYWIGKRWYNFGTYVKRKYRSFKRTSKQFFQAVGLLITTEQQVNGFITEWRNMFMNPVANRISDRTKVFMVNVKVAMHVLYYLYNNQKTEALAHASYLIVTYPEAIVQFIYNLDLLKFKKQVDPVPEDIVIEMTNYEKVTFTEFQRRMKWENDHPGTPYIIDAEQPEGLELHNAELLNLFVSIFSQLKLSSLSETEVRTANNNYNYLKNTAYSTKTYIDFIKCIISTIGRCLFACDPFDDGYQAFVTKILDFNDQANVLVLINPAKLVQQHLRKQILALRTQGILLRQNPQNSLLPNFLLNQFNERFLSLEKLAKICLAKEGAGAMRPRPVSVLFTGPPGVGKTRCMQYLMKEITRLEYLENEFLPPEFTPDMMFPFPDDAYWEGYGGQAFVTMDDVFKTDDKEIRCRQAGTIISLVDTIAYALPMAFGEKGMAHFISKYFFCTTNVANDGLYGPNGRMIPLQLGLVDNGAYERRLHLVLHREEKTHANVTENVYRVDKCICFPNLKGRSFKPSELAQLIYAIKKKLELQDQADEYTVEQLDALRAPKIDFEAQMFNTTKVNGTSLFMRLLRAGYYNWWDSEYRYYYIGFFVFLSLIVVLLPLYLFYKPGSFEPESFQQKNPGGRKHKRRPRVTYGKKNKVHRQKGKHFDAHSDDINYTDSLLGNVSQCIVLLRGSYFSDAEMTKECCLGIFTSQGFHIKNGWIDTPAHFFLEFEDKENVKFEMVYFIKGQKKVINFEMPDYIKIDKEDKVLFKVPIKNFDMPIAGYKYLIKEEEFFEIPQGMPMNFCLINTLGQIEARNVNYVSPTGAVAYTRTGHSFVIEEPITYFSPTRTTFGESGSLVIIKGKQGSPKIIGTHAGASGEGTMRRSAAIPVCKEYYDFYLNDEFEAQHLELFPHEPLRKVPDSEAYWHPTRSKIRQSEMFGIFGPPQFLPAKLGKYKDENGVEIDPYYKAVSKLHQEFTPDYPIPDHCIEWLLNIYPKIDGRVLTFEEALNGWTERGLTSINHGTSAGYPFNLKCTKGKEPYIQRTEEQTFVYDPSFLEFLQDQENKLLNGEQISVIWADVLKDETRTIENKKYLTPRLFAAGPLDYLILTRKYFLDLIQYVQNLHNEGPIAIGINCESIEWTMLYHRLSKCQGSVIAGDFSNWDGRLPRCVQLKFLEFCNRWYDDGPINARVRGLLLEHMYHAVRIHGNTIYQVCDGIPSGSALTAFINSFCNAIKFYTVFDVMGITPMDFQLVVYGDDNVATTNHPNLRCSDLAIHFKNMFGMTYTHWSKAEHEAYDTLDDIRFLGRKFVLTNTYYLCPLELRVVLEAIYWYRGGPTPEEVILSNADTFFLQIFQHGKETYDEYTRLFLTAVQERVPSLYSAIKQKHHTWYTVYKNRYCEGGSPIASVFEPHTRVLKSSVSNFTDNIKDTRNSDMTDRALNEPEPTVRTEIGAFEDVAPIDDGAVAPEILQDPYKGFNMEEFSLDNSLDREYPIGDITWSSTQAISTNIMTYNFPQVLFNQQYIAEKIAYFGLFRAGVRVTFRVTSTKFAYGKLLIWYVPHFGNKACSSVFSMSGFPHILLSAAAGDTMAFDFPFISPYRAMDLNNYDPAELGMIFVTVLNPLVDALNNASISVTVFATAKFIDAKCFLPLYNSVPLTMMERKYGFKMNQKTRSVTFKGETFVSDFEPHVKVHKMPKRNTPNKEAKEKSEKGSISSALTAASNVASVLEYVPGISPFASMFKLGAGLAGDIAEIAGMDKPSTLAMTQVGKINPFCDINYGKGVDLSNKFALDPENNISVDPVVGGIPADEMDIQYIAGMPMLTQSIIVSSTNYNTVVTVDYLSNSTGAYCDVVCTLFKYWNGSFKFKMYIEASQYHSARIVFWIGNQIDPNGWENNYFRIVDVQGPTTTEFTLPYFHKEVMTPYSNSNLITLTRPALLMTCLSYSQPDMTLMTPIFVNVYKAISDIQVAAPIPVTYTYAPTLDFETHSNPRNDFAAVFEPIHPSITAYKQDKLVNGEQITNLRDYLKKYQYYCATANRNFHFWNGSGSDLGVAPNTVLVGIEAISRMFLYWRGSIRMKILSTNSHPLQCFACYDGSTSSNIPYVGSAISCVTNPVMETDFPYYDDLLFKDVYVDDTSKMLFSSTTGFILKAIGDDFSFHFLSPLIGSFAPISLNDSTYGPGGFVVYLNTQ